MDGDGDGSTGASTGSDGESEKQGGGGNEKVIYYGFLRTQEITLRSHSKFCVLHETRCGDPKK